MDRPTCKLCFRRFPNGRALGGHMRSHVASASTAATKHAAAAPRPRGGGGLGSSPTSSSSSGPHQPLAAATKIHNPASYGLRENPRKSAKLADPEFSNPDVVYDDADLAGYYYGSSYYCHPHNQQHHYASSAVVQDGESETESSMAAAAGAAATAGKTASTSSSSRRRSKRRRRRDVAIPALFLPATANAATSSKAPQDEEQAPVSSVSDATPDEDVALCLVMLSRDAWSVKGEQQQYHRHREVAAGGAQEEGEQEASYDDDDNLEAEERVAVAGFRRGGGGGGGRSRFRCGTCNKTFRSYQALGGHRASHKKARPWNAQHTDDVHDEGDHYHYQPPRVDRIRHQQPAADAADDDDDYSEATGSAAAPVGGGSTDPRIHRCPFCSRVFASGQALGGHKRSHFAYSAPQHYSYPPPPLPTKHEAARGANADGAASPTTRNTNRSSRKIGSFPEQLDESSFLDLNLPAPVDELDAEESAVSIAS